jgi:cytochrome P450
MRHVPQPPRGVSVNVAFPPGPPIPKIGTTALWMKRPFGLLEACARRYGEPFSFNLYGFPRLVVVYTPESVKHVFADDGETFAAGRFNRSLAGLLGDKSVLMLDGAEHKRHRKLLLPPFHGERMERYGEAMMRATDDAIDRWRVADTFALHPHTQDIALKVIVRTVFGISEGPRFDETCRRMKRVLELGSWPPLLVPAMQRDLGAWSPWGKFRRAVEEGDATLYEEIRMRRASGERGHDVLSLLLDAKDEAGRPMTDLELRDELTTLLVAGHETTATALAWAVRWTLETDGLLERVRDEIGSGPLTAARAAELPLVDAIVREAMRLNPVIPIVGRVLERPTTVAGYELPKDTPVVCSIYLAQRRPEVYPDPERFDPDRFLRKKFSPSELFPFGGGVRRCIGAAFAMYEMKIVLARLFQRTELALAPKTSRIREQRRSITLMPTDGLLVRYERERREKNGA